MFDGLLVYLDWWSRKACLINVWKVGTGIFYFSVIWIHLPSSCFASMRTLAGLLLLNCSTFCHQNNRMRITAACLHHPPNACRPSHQLLLIILIRTKMYNKSKQFVRFSYWSLLSMNMLLNLCFLSQLKTVTTSWKRLWPFRVIQN